MMGKHKNKHLVKILDMKTLLFLTAYLFKANQVKNNQIINQVSQLINELRSSIIKKGILKNENPNKLIGINKNPFV